MADITPIDKQAKRKEICQRFYAKHKEKLCEKSNEYYRNNKDKYHARYESKKAEIAEYNKEYRRKNREALNQAQKEYRARKKAEMAAINNASIAKALSQASPTKTN